MGRLAAELRQAGPSPDLAEIAQQLRALGASDCSGRGNTEAVYDALVKCWKNRKPTMRPPTGLEIGNAVGLPERRTFKLLADLVRDGRVIRSKSYGWVPRVVKP